MTQAWLVFATAFVAGIVSFLSPCVLPLVPGYLSFITGFRPKELQERQPLSEILAPSLMFVAGFTVVFVALGATASLLGSVLVQYRTLLTRLAGVFIFAMGLVMTEFLPIPALYSEKRMDMAKTSRFGRWTGLFLGMAFAVGWTPCVGPVLASILLLAGSAESVGRGASLLLVYSAGFAVPFLLVAVLFGRVRPLLTWLNRHSLTIARVAGVLLMVLGVLVFSGKMLALARLLQRFVPLPRVG